MFDNEAQIYRNYVNTYLLLWHQNFTMIWNCYSENNGRKYTPDYITLTCFVLFFVLRSWKLFEIEKQRSTFIIKIAKIAEFYDSFLTITLKIKTKVVYKNETVIYCDF